MKSDLIRWVNDSLECSYSKIETLGDCIAYLQLISLHHPDKMKFSKAKCKLISADYRKSRFRSQLSAFAKRTEQNRREVQSVRN